MLNCNSQHIIWKKNWGQDVITYFIYICAFLYEKHTVYITCNINTFVILTNKSILLFNYLSRKQGAYVEYFLQDIFRINDKCQTKSVCTYHSPTCMYIYISLCLWISLCEYWRGACDINSEWRYMYTRLVFLWWDGVGELRLGGCGLWL